MGDEMGNNNTSAIKEEDTTSEAEKKTLLEDTSSELANGISQDVQADGVKEENPNIPTSTDKDVVAKAEKDSDDTAIEVGKDTLQDDSHADDLTGIIQTIPMAESKDVQEKPIGFAPNSTKSMLENDSLEGESDAANDVKMENKMHPIAEAEDVREKATRIASNNITIMLDNDSSEAETHASDMNVENQMQAIAEAEDFQEKATGLASEYKRRAREKDSLEGDTHSYDVSKGKDDQGIAARLGSDDTRNETQNEPQENTHDNDKQDGNVVIPIINGTDDVQEKITILASDDPLHLRYSVGSAVQKITEAQQPEKSPNPGSVEAGGENYEILSSSSLECTGEYEKQKDSCLRKDVLLTSNHHLDNKPSIKQAEEESTTVLTLDAVDLANDSELQESPSVHDELVKVLSEQSLQESESLQIDNFLDTNPHCQQIKDDVSEKEMESQEKMLCVDKSDDKDGDEFGSGLRDNSGTTSDSPSIGDNSNGNLLTKVTYIPEDSLNSLPESFVVDNTLESDHEENYKVLYKESKMSRSGSTVEHSHDYNLDQHMEESLKEFEAGIVNTYDMAIVSNGDCNGERNIVLASSVSEIVNTDQVEEPKVTEIGGQWDECVNNSNKASDEISTASKQNHSVVPEAEVVLLIAGSAVVDGRQEEGEIYKKKIEETDEKPEASCTTIRTFEGSELSDSEQCNSHLVTINAEESFDLQTSALLHVNQTESFTATSTPNSDWKEANDSNYVGAVVDKLDSSNSTIPSLHLVDDEAFEKEGEDCSQPIKASSIKGAELTTSAANMSSEPSPSNSIFANDGYETRLSTESNPDNPNILSQIQKSPSFKLNLRIEAKPEESDQTPLLYQDKSEDEIMSNQTSLNHMINSMPQGEYGECMSQNEELPVEEKIVTMETSYSEKPKASVLGLLKEEEEEGGGGAHLLVRPQEQDNHAGTKKEVKEVSTTSPTGKEKRKPRPSFFSSCICCTTVAN